MTAKFTYQCTTCSKTYIPEETMYLCPECAIKNKSNLPPKGILKTIFKFQKAEIPDSCILASANLHFEALKMNRFIDVLPINNEENLPKLKIGETPLYKIECIDKKELPHNLFLKDDTQNPTYSFKDRASGLISAFAKENRIDTIVAASTGNAGSSLAGICASQGQKAIILVPETAPIAKLSQIIMYGATLIPVKGTYDDAFDLSIKASETYGWYNRNTAYNPLTIEGKKIAAFEIFEQLDYSIPDRIFVPVGDGVILSGIYKGFEDLIDLGIIDKIPVIVAVQAIGSSNLINNINKPDFKIVVSKTLADSISVDIPRNFYMASDYIVKYRGETISVSDDEILNASSKLSKNTGLFAEPAAAAAFSGYLKYFENRIIPENSKNVVMITGSGLKDLKSIEKLIKLPKSIFPNIHNLDKLLKT